MDHSLSLPETITIGSSRTFTPVLFRLDEGEQETFKLNKNLYGLSIVQAVTHGPGVALNRPTIERGSGITVGEVRITFEDEDTTVFPLVLGLGTNRLDAAERKHALRRCGRSRHRVRRYRSHHDTAVERYLYRLAQPAPEVVVKQSSSRPLTQA